MIWEQLSGFEQWLVFMALIIGGAWSFVVVGCALYGKDWRE